MIIGWRADGVEDSWGHHRGLWWLEQVWPQVKGDLWWVSFVLISLHASCLRLVDDVLANPRVSSENVNRHCQG